ncbi:MAG: GtrA family protein [Peptostreptococcaceae bacterium]
MIEKVIKFGFVGIIATLVDYLLLIILKEYCEVSVMYSSGISFSVSVFLNYILSMKYVFVNKRQISKITEFFIFISTAIVGLFLNQIVMYILTEVLNQYYIISKLLSTAIVMFWNFMSRYIFLEK